MEEIKEIMIKSQHGKFIDKICDNLILNGEQKINAVWIHGAANSGKTEFLRRLGKIFTCATYA